MTSSSKIFLYGGGGHANVVSEVLAGINIDVAGIFDDDTSKSITCESGVRIRGELFPELDHPLIITIGDNQNRAELSELLDASFGTAIANSAIVSPTAMVEEGTVVLQGAIIQANTRIGRHCIINTGASVDHDNKIGDFAHISPLASLAGHVEVGEGTQIGSGAIVIPGVKIGKWCTVGAGSVVIQNIPDYCTVVGNPAKVIKQDVPIVHRTNDHFDLVFIGSGLSSTATIKAIIERSNDSRRESTLRIAIIEKAEDWFGGIAFGQRAGTKSLAISNLSEFLPEQDRESFKNWLTENKSWAFKRFHAEAGHLTTRWIMQNAQAIDDNQWDSLYLPRYLFGLYLKHEIQNKIQEAENQGLIEFHRIQGHVNDVKRVDGGFKLLVAAANHSDHTVYCNQAVLSVGSPPIRRLFRSKVYDPRLGGCLLDDVYDKDFSASRNVIKKHLNRKISSEYNFLIVGSNASTIEALYNLWDLDEVRERLTKFYVLSPSAELPFRVDPCVNGKPYTASCLDSLLNNRSFTAKEIYFATKEDVANARKAGLSFGKFFQPISQKVSELAGRLDSDERQCFVDRWGTEISRLQRRAGHEYSDAIDEIRMAGKLEMIAGRFKRVARHGSTGISFDYEDTTGQLKRFPSEIQVAINCAGFEKVDSDSSSSLLRQLIKQQLCQPTPSGSGIRVNKRLEASEGLYVVGPLLAGNLIGDQMVWHAEHCGRIIRFAKLLADELSNGSNTENQAN